MKRSLFFFFLLVSGLTYSQPFFRSGVFLAHSTGTAIWGPNGSPTSIPLEIQAYNALHGLSGNEAIAMNRTSWPDNPWENEWERWHRIFKGLDPNADIFPIIASNRIVVIKSCYPSSSMQDWGAPSDTLNPTKKSVYNYKWHWRNIVNVMAQHPETFFAMWTNAPLNEANTNPAQAMLSKNFSLWAKDTLAMGLDPVMGAFPPNVFVFNYFAKLTDANGYQLPQYAASANDPHPNANATALVAPQFVNEIFSAAIIYEQGANSLLVSPQMAEAPSQSGILLFSVATLLNWTAQSNASWCNVTPSGSGSGNLIASYAQNLETTTRTAAITVSANGAESQTVYLVQAGAAAFLTAEPLVQEVEAEAGTAYYSVNSNVNWICQCDASWVLVTPSGSGSGQISADYEENMVAEARTAILSLIGEGLDPQQIELIQAGSTLGLDAPNAGIPEIVPNPAHGQICIKGLTPIGAQLNYKLLNSAGKLVQQGKTTIGQSTLLRLNGLKAGTYFVELESESTKFSTKVLVY